MRKMKKTLSLILALVMLLSLGTTAFADELEQPVVEEQQPVVEEQQPVVEEQQLVVEEQQPVVEEQQPVVEEQQPVVEEQQPIVEEQQPIVEEQQPIVEEQTVEEETPAVNMPAQNMKIEGPDGLVVRVEIPENALPADFGIRARRVNTADYAGTVNAVLNKEAEIALAVDITFFDGNRQKIEPLKEIKVYMTAPELAGVQNPQIVHIPDVKPAEEVDVLDVPTADNEVAFQSGEFSVYAIVDGDASYGGETLLPRATYEFYNSDGSPYTFYNAAGGTQTSQIIKSGDKLEEVGVPTIGASQNARFMGWYDEDGNKVELGQEMTVTESKTVKLTAKFQGLVNVFFVTAVMKDDQGQSMSRSVVTVKQVEYDTAQTDAITVDTNDVTTDAPTSEQAVVGWNRNQEAANAGTAEGENGVITLYESGSAGEITDVMLFPAIQDAYWLYFNENDGGTGGGASYTPPQFVTVGGKPTQPTAPHRTGYTFGGWYKDAACTQPFDFSAVMRETTTVYAKWEGAQTTYTVIVKVQSTSDSAKITSASNLSHDAKTYDFWKAYTVNANTGATATVANTYKQLANQIDSSGYITYETCDPDTTVAADGSTVLYAYYERAIMTITWRRSTNPNGNISATWYGLYGASFAESGKTWLTPGSGYRWRSSATFLTFKDAFKDFNPAGRTLNLYYGTSSASWYDVYFYTENLDGTWNLDQQFDLTGSSFRLSEKYDAFYLSQYSRNGSTWNTAIVNTEVGTNQNLYIRYARKSFDIEYHNGTLGTEGTVVRTDNIKYDASLTSHVNPTVTYPVADDADHYEFIGWFSDSGWKTMVTFTELDEQTKQNYRDWYGVAEFLVISQMPAHNFPLYAGYALKGWDCAINPNEGTLTNPNQAGVFWLSYGDLFSSDLKTTVTREGYIFQGWMLADVPLTADGNLDLKNIQTDAQNHRFVGDYSNWTITETPWQFDSGITGPTALMAKWFYTSSMSVEYDAGAGTNAPTDEDAYSDGAKTVAFRGPTAPDGKNFIGWDIVGTSAKEKLLPGDTFTVSSDYATNGVVTLQAVYSNPDGSEDIVPVTHITWYANNGTTASVTDEDLQLNMAVAIRPSTQFSYEGHQFCGWAKLPTPEDGGMNPDASSLTEADLFLKFEDGSFKAKNAENAWVVVTEVAADEVTPYDDLYAVWKSVFYVVHSGEENAVENKHEVAMPENGGTYDLTAEITDGFLYGGYYLEAGVVDSEDPYDGDNWTWSNPQTAAGNAITPVVGETYYIKEVPADTYLKPYTHYTYKKATGKIGDILMLSDVDDLNYNATGFIITTNNEARVCRTLSVKNSTQTLTIKLTPSKLFGIPDYGSADGSNYLTWLAVYNSSTNLISNGSTVQMYWDTMDGMRVTGDTIRTLNGIEKKSTFTKSDEIVDPVITPIG